MDKKIGIGIFFRADAAGAIASIKRLGGATDQMGASLSTNSNKFGTHMAVSRAAMGAARAEAAKLGASFNTLHAAIGAIGLGAAMRIPIDFESSMADVKKVVDFANEMEFKKFQSGLLGLTDAIPRSASQLAAIAASGGQLGIAKERLLGFTTTVAKMSTAFDMGAEQAGDSIARLMNVYSLQLGEVGKLGDAINHLSDNSAAKAAQVVETLGRIGGVSKTFGLTAVQSAALSSAFIALGKSPEVASTSINALLMKLSTAPKQGKAFQDALEMIGLDAQQLADDIQVDAQGALTGFLEALKEVDKSEQVGILTDLFGMEYADDIALLVGGLDNYQKALRLTAEESAYLGSMEREFQNRSKTTANSLQLVRNSLEKTAITVGSTLLPAIGEAAAKVQGLALRFAAWAENNQESARTLGFAIAGVAGFMAAGVVLQGVLMGVNAVLGLGRIALMGYYATIWAVRLGMAAFSATLGVVRAGVLALSIAMAVNPIGAVAAAIAIGVAAIAGAAALIYVYWEPIKAFFAGLWDGIKSLFASGPEWFQNIIGAITLPWRTFFDWLGEKFAWFGEAIGKIKGLAGTVKGWFGGGEDEAAAMPKVGAAAQMMPANNPDYAPVSMGTPLMPLPSTGSAAASVRQDIQVQITFGDIIVQSKDGKIDNEALRDQVMPALREMVLEVMADAGKKTRDAA